MPLRIVRCAAPIYSANVTWIHQRALKTGRSIDLAEPGGLDLVRAPLPVLRVFPPGIIGRKGFWNERNRGSRLRRPGLFASDIALRHGALFDRQEWRARQTVKHENAAHLRGDGN